MIIAVICIVTIKNVDQRRWQRYQIERDLHFRDHPYVLKSEPAFNVRVIMSKSAHFKLINTLMLKQSTQQVFKKAMLQREKASEQDAYQFVVKVLIEDIHIGYLEQHYAETFCEVLKESDFYIGRPISILSEVTFCKNNFSDAGCKVVLGLPLDPNEIKDLIEDRFEIEVEQKPDA
ncbi:hypothetical protein G9F32_02390 [Acinetobacter sp. 194]|nr:hypothetical protein [Acinetobacter shaoyimingii]